MKGDDSGLSILLDVTDIEMQPLLSSDSSELTSLPHAIRSNDIYAGTNSRDINSTNGTVDLK